MSNPQSSSTPPPPPPTPSSSTTPESDDTTSDQRKNFKWVENGPQGVSAISVVLDWIEKLGNYQRWKGGGAAGETKEVICTEVNNLLREKGFPCRTNKHVRHKIQDLEKSYRTAVDWKNNTGQGILDAGGAGSEDLIRKEILRRCPFWDTLSPVMGERLSSRPPVTNESDQVVSRTRTPPTPHTVQTHRHPAGQSLPTSSRDNRSSTPGSANSVGRIRTDEQSQELSASLTSEGSMSSVLQEASSSAALSAAVSSAAASSCSEMGDSEPESLQPSRRRSLDQDRHTRMSRRRGLSGADVLDSLTRGSEERGEKRLCLDQDRLEMEKRRMECELQRVLLDSKRFEREEARHQRELQVLEAERKLKEYETNRLRIENALHRMRALKQLQEEFHLDAEEALRMLNTD
ncbi:hypothetical protein DFJ73DRAFT_92423 [Zopfochytrium polystomum]|nr:hypothetical protein DFJ73DRAFT_92423 [Zopfochytrium polystomum]